MRMQNKGRKNTQNRLSKQSQEEDSGINKEAMGGKRANQMRDGNGGTTMKETTTQKNRWELRPRDPTEGAGRAVAI